MPDNEVEDGICNFFELDKSSQGLHPSHSVDGTWSMLNDSQWVGQRRRSLVPFNVNLQNNGIQKLDSLRGRGCESTSVHYKSNYSKLTPRPEYNRTYSRNFQLNTNGSCLGNQSSQTMQNQPRVLGGYTGYDQHNLILRGFSTLNSQPEYESGTDSPTLTANSERSEITEVSTEFNFLGEQQQLAKGRQPVIQQPGQMQQSGYSDMHLLQQDMMFKHLQELQRQQQLQQLGDVRQHNSINQQSAMSKQASGIQFSPLNGTVNDVPPLFMNWPQFGASTAGQGVSNRITFSPENGQPWHSMGHIPRPLDGSLYGTPVTTGRSSSGQYPEAQNPMLQSSAFSNPFTRDQFTVSPDQLSMLQGALISSQGFPGKNKFGDVPDESLSSGILSGNLQEGKSLQTSASVKEFNGRQKQTSWPAMWQKTVQHSPSLGLVSLDPVEEKILYNVEDDTIWDASYGRHSDPGAIAFSSTLETADMGNSFPSIQSGSWSALMQSAVAEASSSDTGLQEEWSGLTFQNTEQSTDNQISNRMENENQPTGWVDNNLQSASTFISKPLHTPTDPGMSSSIPGFQQPGIQFPAERREGLHRDVSHESVEKSPKVIGEWVECNPQQKRAREANQQDHALMHLNNARTGQKYESSEGEAREQRKAANGKDSQVNFSAVPSLVITQQTTNQQVSESNQSKYMGHAGIPAGDKEKERVGRNSQQLGKGPYVNSNSYDVECETHEKQNNYYQCENSNGSYNCKGLAGSEQDFSGQFQFFDKASSYSVNLEQGRVPHFSGISKVSKEVPSKFTSLGSDVLNAAIQASQNMLELPHKVDQPQDDFNIRPYGSADCNLLDKVPEAEISNSGSQYNQSPAFQGFGLRLSSPQRLCNMSHMHYSHGLPQTLPHSHPYQVNSELRQKHQARPASASSAHVFTSSHELLHWDDKSNASELTGTCLYLNHHGNSSAAYMPDPTSTRNQPHVQVMSGAPVTSLPSHETLPPIGIGYPLSNVSASQDYSRQVGTSDLSQEFPVLEAVPVPQPSVISVTSQEDDISARPQNVWTNIPSHRPPTVPEHLKVSSNFLSSNFLSSNFLSSKDSSDTSTVGTPKGRHGSSEFVAGCRHQISSEIVGTSMLNLGAGSLAHCSLTGHSHQLDLGRVKNEENNAHSLTGRNMVSAGRSLESSSNLHQNYSPLDQFRATKHIETDPSKRSPGVPHDSFSSRDSNMMKFPTESIDDPQARPLPQPTLQDRVTNVQDRCQNSSQNQSRINNLVSNLIEHSQFNPHMVSSWWRQFGNLKNGQMLPIYNARIGTGTSLGNPDQNLLIPASVERVDSADTIQSGNVMPNAVATLAGHISALQVLPTDITCQNMAIMRPKKRKLVTQVPSPWHKQVTECSQRVQNMSTAEECWTQATNRVFEKVEDEVEMAEHVQPMLPSKRRLILTTQLVQQLLCPAPKFILSADVTSHHDSVLYFISRLSLGDACNFTFCVGNDILVSMGNSNMTSEKLKNNVEINGQQLLEVVDKLSARAEKLENDFRRYESRVDETASVVDVRVECQELERFAVINRFAKFHIRAQADTSGNMSFCGPTNPFLHRYVTALPMPRKLPEGLQCISL